MVAETLDSPDTDLKPLVVQLLARIDVLLARIAELEAGAGAPPKPAKTSANSSLPPASGRKANVPEPPEKKGRKGRPGVARTLCAEPDRVLEVHAQSCGCGAVLTPADQPDVHAYDHVDLPPIRPVTTRIHLHKGCCPRCQKRFTAAAPAGMAPGTPFGPGIVAAATYLHACQLVSYSRLTEMFDGLFGLKISEGAIANPPKSLIWAVLSRAAKPFADRGAEIAAIVRGSAVIASDETSARVCGKTFWQWVFSAAKAVWHTIAPTRGKAVPVEFLDGTKPAVWLSDRYAGQGKLAVAHQYCLAHLIRDARYAAEAGDAIFAPAFKRFLKKACAIGRRRPGMGDATIATWRRALEKALTRLLALKPTNSEGEHLRASMSVDARDKLLVFLTRRDIEPTNNQSERALRPSVIFRKVTNGFRSRWGATVYADICSIVATGRLSGCSPLASLRAALA